VQPAHTAGADCARALQANVNLHGVFLHMLGDALGSIGVLASGLCVLLMPWDWKEYIDPSISIFICLIILKSTVPLVRYAARILLQGVPHGVDLSSLRRDILAVPGVLRLHELHAWLLVDSTSIASVHLEMSRSEDFMLLAKRVRRVLHKHGIHSSTIQPEFVSDSVDAVRAVLRWVVCTCADLTARARTHTLSYAPRRPRPQRAWTTCAGLSATRPAWPTRVVRCPAALTTISPATRERRSVCGGGVWL